ncbi:RCC1 domain-containing protein [Kibdelosporangium phytohabitans]|uniref:RCC1 domain-containing protein n=1 Tax=Kibdelosporangium phytohabitans TaxID=860235 RepID=UPI001470295E
MAENPSRAVIAWSIFCWGANTTGQLGDGNTIDRLPPVVVQGIPSTTGVAGDAATPVP